MLLKKILVGLAETGSNVHILLMFLGESLPRISWGVGKTTINVLCYPPALEIRHDPFASGK